MWILQLYINKRKEMKRESWKNSTLLSSTIFSFYVHAKMTERDLLVPNMLEAKMSLKTNLKPLPRHPPPPPNKTTLILKNLESEVATFWKKNNLYGKEVSRKHLLSFFFLFWFENFYLWRRFIYLKSNFFIFFKGEWQSIFLENVFQCGKKFFYFFKEGTWFWIFVK